MRFSCYIHTARDEPTKRSIGRRSALYSGVVVIRQHRSII